MAPDPEKPTNPNNPIPHIPAGAVLVPGFSTILDILHDAWDMFGSGSTSDQPQPSSGGGSGASSWANHQVALLEGKTGDAEQNAAKALADKTETLKSLDAQLRGVADQILDNNNASKKKLEALAAEVEKELKYLEESKDDSGVKTEAATQFLGEKSGEIIKVLTDAANDIDSSRAALEQIGQGYGGGVVDGGGGAGDVLPEGGGGAGGAYGGGAEPLPQDYQPGMYDSGQYGEGQQPGIGETLGQAASAIPQALGGLGGGMGNPLGDIGSTIGGLIGKAADSQSREDRDNSRSEREREADEQKRKDDAAAEQKKKDDEAAAEQKKKDDEAAAQKKREQEQQQQTGATGGGTPAPPPAPAPTMVTRPDGTPAQAANSAIAAAARAHLGGADIGDAYKAAGITLPPPGTTLKDTIPPGQATMGDLAMFKDKWVMLLGDNKVYVDGQQQPASVLGKMPGFMGFTHPPASIMPTVAAAPAVPNAPAGAPPQVSAAAQA
ncbi:DUF4226 domain-containing protein [Mycobacteroides abscessus]|uniref:DUF4226 domain-containing protein n=1 Tax=Mycobacteroides abscessus TaxID=36809 RepID=UPI00092B859C|nr:DUF4226 domain-containing protein [Mycobacteroides abscessus]SIC22791.1 Biofilm regulator BssS [Mycobacteroides abscessus subsp. abscessus]